VPPAGSPPATASGVGCLRANWFHRH
jgi:hypothetical protein